MKLLFCLNCQDIFSLSKQTKTCSCGESRGRYIDDLNAEIKGNCEPIEFSNKSFSEALKIQRLLNKRQEKKDDVCCKGVEFTAFIIPDWAKSIKIIK